MREQSAEVENLKHMNSDLMAANADLRTQIEENSQVFEDKDKQLEDAEQQIQRLSDEIDEMRQENKLFKAIATDLTTTNAELRNQLLCSVYLTTIFQSSIRALYRFGRLFFLKFGNGDSMNLPTNGVATKSKTLQKTYCPVIVKKHKTISSIVRAKWRMKFMFRRRNAALGLHLASLSCYFS